MIDSSVHGTHDYKIDFVLSKSIYTIECFPECLTDPTMLRPVVFHRRWHVLLPVVLIGLFVGLVLLSHSRVSQTFNEGGGTFLAVEAHTSSVGWRLWNGADHEGPWLRAWVSIICIPRALMRKGSSQLAELAPSCLLSFC